MGNLEGRLVGSVEGLAFALLVAAVFWLFSLFVRFAFKKKIASATYYTVAIVSGFLLHRALTRSLTSSRPSSGNESGEMGVMSASAGLDAPFIAPTEKDVGRFPAQLSAATAELTVEERKQLTEAVSFLSFGMAASLAEQDSARFNQMQDSDLAARSLARLYEYAEKQGSFMTLRKYVELAAELGRQKPQWLADSRRALRHTETPQSNRP